MSDRRSAEIFGEFYKYLYSEALKETDEKVISSIKSTASFLKQESKKYDFHVRQMEADEERKYLSCLEENECPICFLDYADGECEHDKGDTD